jgi:outer membrane protein OmpA-like peptidoglycan-associated protein
MEDNMRVRSSSLGLFALLLIILPHAQGPVAWGFSPQQASSQRSAGGKEYPDGHGGTVYFPLGDMSFADEAISFESGDPAASNPRDRDPKQSLGIPNYDSQNDVNYTTLGCAGVLTLRFVDNALVDIPGPDLYVFEIGPNVEPTRLAISEDGTSWVEIGEISGGRADVDIQGFIKPGQIFHFVRLTDLKSGCGGSWPGADIDAVGAIGSILQFSLNSAVLFDFNSYTLKPEAKTELDRIIEPIAKWPGATIIIEGHTDAVGSPEKNQVLSENRAAAVREFFKFTRLAGFKMTVAGYGESRPVATNDTDEGRAKNRRVEILVVPSSNPEVPR